MMGQHEGVFSMKHVSRRQFVGGAAAAAAAFSMPISAWAAGSNFKIGVISDEISDDLDHACYVINKQYGLHYVELRGAWGKNLQDITDAQIAEAQKILAKYGLTVTDIASPLYKVDWPDAPPSQYGSKADMHGAAEATFKQQDDVLRRSMELAKQFKTNKVRCFDFWRLDDVKPYRAAINEKLQQSAEFAGKQCWRTSLPATREPAARRRRRSQAFRRGILPSTGTRAMRSCAVRWMPIPVGGTPCRRTASIIAM
jgi:hypothetical protein